MRYDNDSNKKENRYVVLIREFGKPQRDFPKRNHFAVDHLTAGNIDNCEYEQLAIEGLFGPRIAEDARKLMDMAIDNLIKGKQ